MTTLYEQLAGEISQLIESGVLRPGERIPSVRATCRGRSMSPATVMHAYGLLEDRGLISTLPRSGYYVALSRALPPEPNVTRPSRRTIAVDVNDTRLALARQMGATTRQTRQARSSRPGRTDQT